MPCYSPLQGFRSRFVNASGKRGIVFSISEGFSDLPVSVPCGQCVGCRLERSRQWAIRCVHEAQLHDDNCFITLTFNNESLFKMCLGGSLNVKHFQDFMKRFRSALTIPASSRFVSEDFRLRFYHCGEYGSKFGRPHYHALIFGYDFPDKKFWKFSGSESNNFGIRSLGKIPLYRSEFLEELWPFGYSSVGSATFESAAYVARYIMKKVTGPGSDEHYRIIDPDTGEYVDRKPEYTTMSRRPGIGKAWFDKFGSDVYPSDEVLLRGIKMKPPKFYDSLYELECPDDYERIKGLRRRSAVKHKDDCTPERLAVRRKVKESQIKRLVRNVDNGDFDDL